MFLPSLAPWPEFTPHNKVVLQLQRDNITTIPDGELDSKVLLRCEYDLLNWSTDFHLENSQFLNSARVLNEMEK